MTPNKFNQNQKISNALQFRLSRTKEIEDLFVAEINGRENMRKALNNYVAVLNHADLGSGVCLFWFTTVIGVPTWIASANTSHMFYFTNGFV